MQSEYPRAGLNLLNTGGPELFGLPGLPTLWVFLAASRSSCGFRVGSELDEFHEKWLNDFYFPKDVNDLH
jgi:hypothetical protein